MVARIAGGAVVGWILSLAPLIALNALSLTSGAVDPSSTALAGIGALAAGVALGGLSAGLIGGRRGGAFAGTVAGALCAASLIGLMYYLQAQGALPVLVALHPLRTLVALLFLGALVACIALGVSAALGLRAARAEEKSVAAFAAARGTGPRPSGDPAGGAAYGSDPRRTIPRDHPRDYSRDYSREPAASARQAGEWQPDTRRGPPASASREPPRSDRRPAAARYDSGYPGYESRERRSDTSERW